jgi:hypothetical protein
MEKFSQILLHVKYESNFLETSFHIFANLLESWIEIWTVILNFGWNMTIENLKKHINLSLLILR